MLQAATLVDGSTRLAELGVRQGDLLFVQNCADVPCPSGAPVARDAEGSVAALPDHLRRVLAEAGPVTSPHYALLLAAHAALLESGLEPAWPVLDLPGRFFRACFFPCPNAHDTLEPSLAENTTCQHSTRHVQDVTKREQAHLSTGAVRLACY